jgi:hypothetical protein
MEFILYMNVYHILEAFDSPYEYEKIADAHDLISFKFASADGSNVYIDATSRTRDGSWLITFDREDKKGNLNSRLTGQGDAYRIYATVLSALRDFVKSKNPEKVSFTADKNFTNSRERLYDRLVKKFAQSFGYELDNKKSSFLSDNATYYLVKK